MTGPLCHQGIMDPGQIEEFKDKRVVDLVMEVGGPIMALAVGVIISLLNSILELDPSVLGPITGTKKVRPWQSNITSSHFMICNFNPSQSSRSGWGDLTRLVGHRPLCIRGVSSPGGQHPRQA